MSGMNSKQQSKIGRACGIPLRSHQNPVPPARNDGILATTNSTRLPYILSVAILRSKGYILGIKKVKTVAGRTSNDFAIKTLLYRNRSITFLIQQNYEHIIHRLSLLTSACINIDRAVSAARSKSARSSRYESRSASADKSRGGKSCRTHAIAGDERATGAATSRATGAAAASRARDIGPSHAKPGTRSSYQPGCGDRDQSFPSRLAHS